ncbi:hypothetical protein GGI25_001271 [Coemansia spiralis]|uniref:Uncharacterized protein n=2 Tax=Coemansia TaxID=4863 RepID=A0A9W8GAE7_9FUNG|nr:hypothetical protein BX070DRAFT_220945 [Coemansia spiralis]KAJ1994969.1 hypothetical protein EDC05_001345 [Coemansia umbellata]KAJ2624593.1 hypothetical protein GGI26_001286 [Coemansia sp. RSA 1358]KAJ2679819.1 hypothetical protein GGI25_001271 [Coemansia spiralis]
MVKSTAKDKEKIKQVQEIEAQLRASANSVSHLVSSWLGDDDDSSGDDTKDKEATKTGANGLSTVQQPEKTVKARDIFQGRPARLGVGAKFLSHKEMMAANKGGQDIVTSTPGVLTSDELRLKRKLTKGSSNSGMIGSEKAAKKHDNNVDDNDEGDSRSKMLGKDRNPNTANTASNSTESAYLKNQQQKFGPGGQSSHPAKKQKRSTALLDSLIQQRRR